jgi:molybdopterin/thiamine biosynthesis adenylyltransferase
MHTSSLSPAELTRYSRQLTLEGWGREAQELVKSSRVLIAGIGGLGTIAALYLLAGGVGTVRLVDYSRVDLSDLGHQVLFRELDLGKPKAAVAERRLRELNPFAAVTSQAQRITDTNASRLASGYHLLIDATNDSGAKLLLNQASARHGIPLVCGWVWEMNGYLTTSWPGRGPCSNCALPEGSRAGVPALLGPLPGVLGSLLALEALRILGGLGPALLGRLLIFKGRPFQFREKSIKPDPRCPICSRPAAAKRTRGAVNPRGSALTA